MNYLSLSIILVVIIVLYLVLKNTKDFFITGEAPVAVENMCLENLESHCTTYKTLMNLIMMSSTNTAFNSLENLNLKNHLKSWYDLSSDYTTKVNNVKGKIKAYIDNDNPINIGTDTEPNNIDNPFYNFDIYKYFEGNHDLSDELINSRNEELTTLANAPTTPSTGDGRHSRLDVGNCAFQCFRFFLNPLLGNQQIPDEDFSDLSELQSTILTYLIITNPEFSGIIPLAEFDLQIDNKFNTFGDMLNRRKDLLNNISGAL
jgi:hypothetical protein